MRGYLKLIMVGAEGARFSTRRTSGFARSEGISLWVKNKGKDTMV
jgi:hypothetical protein